MIPGQPVDERTESKEERRLIGQPFLGGGGVGETGPGPEGGLKPGQ
jgi:hypothetical protein